MRLLAALIILAVVGGLLFWLPRFGEAPAPAPSTPAAPAAVEPDVRRSPFDLAVWYVSRAKPTPTEVTWQAHVCNYADRDTRIRYVWRRDGKEIDSGEVVLPPRRRATQSATVGLTLPADLPPYHLTFECEPALPAREYLLKNNVLTVRSDAASLGLWVERGVWDFFDAYQHRVPLKDANGLPGWVKRQLNELNARLTRDPPPAGEPKAVRLDQIVVIDAGRLSDPGPATVRALDAAARGYDVVLGMILPEDPGVRWSLADAQEAIVLGDFSDALFVIDPGFIGALEAQVRNLSPRD